jgi:DNA-binding NtrC family response regulator
MTGTVLLYQNDQGLRDVVLAVLTDEGHPVIACDSLAEVQARSRMDPTALALIDTWGPSYGVLAESERQNISAFAAQVPSVMLTARSWSQAVSADELGLLALLETPIGLDQLVDTIRQQVTRLRTQNQAARGRGQ